MSITKRRGQLAQGIIWFNVFLFLLILTTIYLILSASLSWTRDIGKFSLSSFNYGENVLLHSFSFDGKERMIFDSLFQMGGLDGKQGKEKELYDKVIDEVNVFSRANMEKYDKGACVMISSPFAYIFSKNGDFDPAKEIQLPLYKSSDEYNEINIRIKGEEKIIGYYDGECIR